MEVVKRVQSARSDQGVRCARWLCEWIAAGPGVTNVCSVVVRGCGCQDDRSRIADHRLHVSLNLAAHSTMRPAMRQNVCHSQAPYEPK